jgi:hypothetical protein
MTTGPDQLVAQLVLVLLVVAGLLVAHLGAGELDPRSRQRCQITPPPSPTDPAGFDDIERGRLA